MVIDNKNIRWYKYVYYANLNDVEFEALCKDVMGKKLSVKLRLSAKDKDGGIDLKMLVLNNGKNIRKRGDNNESGFSNVSFFKSKAA